MTTIGFISDIHSNREALEAVLADAKRVGVERLVCLGDVVGYGPDPGVCLDLVASSCDAMVRGNHDEAVLNSEFVAEFHPRAATSIQQTRDRLSPGHLMLIESMRTHTEVEGIALTHGSFGPRRYEYLYGSDAAARSFAGFSLAVGVVGHTHLPSLFIQHETRMGGGMVESYAVTPGVEVALPRDARVILNPGSVGQPRDRNPDAAWGVLRTDRMTFEVRRVAYDVDAVQRKILAMGLPDYHGLRLKAGV
jgi:predicted phosphodiesterase